MANVLVTNFLAVWYFWLPAMLLAAMVVPAYRWKKWQGLLLISLLLWLLSSGLYVVDLFLRNHQDVTAFKVNLSWHIAYRYLWVCLVLFVFYLFLLRQHRSPGITTLLAVAVSVLLVPVLRYGMVLAACMMGDCPGQE